jgi:hypothetical protein
MSTALERELEAIIDSRGIHAVLVAIGRVCANKSEHIAVNWQDASLAKRWIKLTHALAPIIAKTVHL